MQSRELQVEGRSVRVHEGGDPSAPAMLLLHGGWGGAALHWAPVWERLSERCRVIAPELPGFGHGSAPGPRSLPEFGAWSAALLAALGVDAAWIVGNAFGGAVGWELATAARDRVRGLCLLDGGPPPEQPWMLRKFFQLGMARGFLRHALKNGLFGPHAIERGFADPARAPAELAALIAAPDPEPLGVLVEAILRGGAAARVPRVPVLVVWGEADRLPGTDPGTVDRLEAARNPPHYETIPGAGHLPQLEQPAAVADRILAFVEGGATSAAP